MFRDKKFLKAIALVLLYHAKANDSKCKKYTVGKLRKITGASYCAIRARVKTLQDYDLARIEDGNLIFASITSKHRERNQYINNVSYKNLAEVEKSLYAILVCILQSRKDYIHRAFLLSESSHNPKTIKKAKRILRKYARGEKFTELGLSYRTIAQKLGVSIKTAFTYVKHAVLHKFISLQNHFSRRFLQNVNFYPVPGYTFTTRNYAYLVYANTYTILESRERRGAGFASLGSRCE